MKKNYLIVLLALLGAPTVHAQMDDGGEIPAVEHKNAFFIGPKAGITITTMGQPNSRLYDGNGIGFSCGVAAKVRFGAATEYSHAGTGLFGVGLELKFKKNTVKTIGTNETGKKNANLSVGYFEVPVFLQIYPFYKNRIMNTFYVEFGPDFAGTLTRDPKSLKVTDPHLDYIRYELDSDKGKLKGGDVRIMLGAGYTIPKTSLDVNARYYWGTSDLAGNLPCKMNSIEVSLSWLFNAAKY